MRVGANTLRALAYHEVRSSAATGTLPWRADPELVLQLTAHNMWDPDQKAAAPAHDIPEDVTEELWVRGILKTRGPHAPKAVLRPLSSRSTRHQWKGVEAQFRDLGIKKSSN
jgi:hypothetical protein